MTGPFISMAILVVAFFFLIVLPQRRRAQAHQAMQQSLRQGDDVMTTAGIHGRIVSLADETLELEIAPDVVITLARGAVGRRLSAPNALGEPGGQS